MTWNYRVVAFKNKEEVEFKVLEVYYNDEGIPDGYAENNSGVTAEKVTDILWTLRKMEEGAKKPVLSGDDFPNEYVS